MIKELLKLHEGIELGLYQCTAGKTTIGVGRNIEDRGISEDEAELMLTNDLSLCRQTLRDKIENWSNLSEVRKAVLIDMAFNLGWTRLSKFKKFLGAVQIEDWQTAAIEMEDSRWWSQVGTRAERLQNMLIEDKWPYELT